MRELLLEVNDAAHAARQRGASTLGRRKLKAFLDSYDALVREGLDANPPLVSRERNSLERESYNLVLALRNRRSEATRFACDLSVPSRTTKPNAASAWRSFTPRSAAASSQRITPDTSP